MRKFIYPLLAIFVLSASCKKEKLPEEPSIELVEVSSTSLIEFQDLLYVTIRYTDNNGDLGTESPDQYSLQVKDSRLAGPDWYHVAPLAPIGQNIKIDGELKLKLNKMFILGNSSHETLTLTLKIQDRAGNWSNELVSPAITISK